MGGMSMQSVGTYIRLLRESQQMTANDVAFATGLNVTYIWRVESGDTKDPGMHRISKIIDALKGSGDHVMKLFLDPQPTDAYIAQLAREALLSEEERAKAKSFLVTDEETRLLIESVQEKATDPLLRNRIRGYVDSLTSADVPQPSAKPRRTSRRRPAG